MRRVAREVSSVSNTHALGETPVRRSSALATRGSFGAEVVSSR